MTTTNTYNPILSAFRILTTAEAFRWYWQQLRHKASLAKTITFYGFTTAQRLLSDRKSLVAVSETEVVIALPEPEKAFAQTILGVQADGDAVEVLENAISSQPEYESTKANEPEELPVPYGWEAIEADDTAIDELEQAEAEWEAISPHKDFAPSEAQTIALAIAPGLNDSECDHIAIDEPQQAIAPEPDFSNAIANDGEADAALAWVDDAEDTEDPVSHQPEDEAEALAGDEA